MKNVLLSILFAALLGTLAVAQYGAPAQQQPPGQSTVPQGQQQTPPSAAPSQGQQQQAPPAAQPSQGQQQAPPSAAQPGAPPAAGAQQPSAPKGPQPKSKEEYDAYLAAANEPDPAKAEEAVKGFEQKFPQSELKGTLYQQVMAKYQHANNADKTVEMGRKALQFEPDSPIALITVASVIAERTRDTDLDAQEKFAEGKKDAERAIQLIDTRAWAPAQISPQQLDMVKSMAYVALGAMELNRKNDVAAEQALRKAVELNTLQPDAVTFLRLALALDHQKKYADALTAANRAVELAASEPTVREKALQEQSRLKQLTGSPTGAAATGNSGTSTVGTKGAAPPPKPQEQQPPR
jgi:tetratricopeptide (TPR) repeat protein